MIAQRLQRDDVNALLAMMDRESRQNKNSISKIGNIGEDSMFGQALIKKNISWFT